jgi:hypothetical protein
VPLALALAVFLFWAAKDGGYAETRWLPGALFVLGLAVAVACGHERPFRGRPELALAVGLLSAFTAWTFATIAWADVKGVAWDGANRTLLYLCTFALFAWRPVPARVAALLLGGFALATAAIGGVDFLRVVGAQHPSAFFIEGRLSTPISYPNANAALFLAASIPAVVLASRREVTAVARPVLLAAAGVLLELAVMCQSRASLAAFPLALVVLVAIDRDRLRLILPLAAVGVTTALAAPALLDVYGPVRNGRPPQFALTHARDVLLWSTIALLLVGAAVAALDRLLRLPRRATRALGWLAGLATIGAVVGGSIVFVDRYGEPRDKVASAWHEFKSEKRVNETTSHLASGFSTPRYDLWRVAVDEFKSAPVIGVGADNFAVDYLRLRHTQEEPMHPHSLELRVLSQTGLVGATLFLGFLAAALVGAARLLRRADRYSGALAAACLGAFAYWLFHGSVDWLWEFPALGAPAMAWLALAARVGEDEQAEPARPLPMAAVLPIALVAAAVAANIAFPWISAKTAASAAATWPADPSGAFHKLDLARRLNPLSDEPDLIAGVIASRFHDVRRERTAFERVLDRNPYNWYARFELAIIDANEGKRAAALAALRGARRLDPREPLIPYVRGKIEHRRPVSQAQIDALLRERTAILTGAHQR